MEQWASQSWEIKHSLLDSIVDKLDRAVNRGEEELLSVRHSFRESLRQGSPPTPETPRYDRVRDREIQGAGSTNSLACPSPREQVNNSCPDTCIVPVDSGIVQSPQKPVPHEAPVQDLTLHLRQHVELPLQEVAGQLAQISQTSEKQVGLLAELVKARKAFRLHI